MVLAVANSTRTVMAVSQKKQVTEETEHEPLVRCSRTVKQGTLEGTRAGGQGAGVRGGGLSVRPAAALGRALEVL